MSASASESSSNPVTNTNTASTQGAAGANSPTITAGSTVNYNDPGLQLATIQSLAQVVMAALTGAGSVAAGALGSLNQTQSQVAQQTAAETTDQNSLLSQVLAADNSLAAAQGTGGASLTSGTNNYVIFGAVAVAIVAIFALIMGRRKAA